MKVCFLTASKYTEYKEFLKENPNVTVKCFARKPLPIGDLAEIVKEQLKGKNNTTIKKDRFDVLLTIIITSSTINRF